MAGTRFSAATEDVEAGELLLDLCHDAALFGQGGEGDIGVAHKHGRHTQLARRSGHVSLRVFSEFILEQIVHEVVSGKPFPRTQHMKLRRTTTGAISQPLGNGYLSVLHARSYLGKQNVTF